MSVLTGKERRTAIIEYNFKDCRSFPSKILVFEGNSLDTSLGKFAGSSKIRTQNYQTEGTRQS